MTHTIPETKAQAGAAVSRVAGKARDAINSAKSAVQDSIGSVGDRTRMARDWANDRLNAARDMPGQLADRGADYIRARPYVMLGLALAIGYVIGRLMSDDMRRRDLDDYSGARDTW